MVMECMVIMWYFITSTASVKLHLYSKFYALLSIKLEVEFRLAFAQRTFSATQVHTLVVGSNIIKINCKVAVSPGTTLMAIVNKKLKCFDYFQTIKYISDNVFQMSTDGRFVL